MALNPGKQSSTRLTVLVVFHAILSTAFVSLFLFFHEQDGISDRVKMFLMRWVPLSPMLSTLIVWLMIQFLMPWLNIRDWNQRLNLAKKKPQALINLCNDRLKEINKELESSIVPEEKERLLEEKKQLLEKKSEQYKKMMSNIEGMNSGEPHSD